MGKAYRILLSLLSGIIGCVFVYSAYTKMYPVASFERPLQEYLHMPAHAAELAARAIIALEAGIGLLLLLQLYGRRKWPLWAALIMLAVFSGYIAWLWALQGNNVNCGCFGDYIWMRPSASLIKNLLLLGGVGLLIRYHRGFAVRWVRIAMPALLILCFAFIYALLPVFRPYPLDMALINSVDRKYAPATDLAKGKHIVALVNPNCEHCRNVAAQMAAMKKEDAAIPFYLVIGDTTTDLGAFMQQTHAENIPYSRMPVAAYATITKGWSPLVLLLDNGLVESEQSAAAPGKETLALWLRD